MNLYLLILLGIIINLFSLSDNKWEQKIIPLKSNRADVEKLLGKSKVENCFECNYETVDEKIKVSYATEKCKGALLGWDVPTDVVLTFSVEPKKKQSVKEIDLDLTGLIGFTGHTLTSYYIDSKKGIMYTIEYGELERITYLPIEENNNLRCQGFPLYNVAGSLYPPVDEIYNTNFENGRVIIGNLFIDLMDFNYLTSKMYVVFYSGENITSEEYKRYIEEVKKYFDEKLPESKSYIEFIDGGNRERFKIDIFVLPKDYPKPMPLPDFPRK